MPKKKSSGVLQSCNCCGYQSTNVWNHIEKSKECKTFYYDNRQFHLPHVSMNNNSSNKPRNKKQKHINDAQQPSSTHAMFGQYIALNSINPFINDIDNACNNDEDFDFCNDELTDEDLITQQSTRSSLQHKSTQSTSTQLLNFTQNDYSLMSSNMNSLITNSVFNPSTLLSMKLFKILNKANAPLYLFDELYTFMKHSVPILQHSKTSTLLKRNKLLSTLYSIIFNGSQLTKSRHHRNLRYKFNLFPCL